MAELKRYKEKVYAILRDSEGARNNDGVLMAHYINIYHPDLVRTDEEGDKVIKLKSLKMLPPFENIRRVRQIIQNVNNEFLPTDASVRKNRRIKEANWREYEVREANKA